MKKSTKKALLAYAYDALASELESYRVPVTYQDRTWYDAKRGDCDGPFWEAMRLAESLGDDWPYAVIWAKGRRYFRVTQR
jgi:hypothetical protein